MHDSLEGVARRLVKNTIYIYTYISQSFSLFAEISMLYSLLSPDSEGVDFYRLDTV